MLSVETKCAVALNKVSCILTSPCFIADPRVLVLMRRVMADIYTGRTKVVSVEDPDIIMRKPVLTQGALILPSEWPDQVQKNLFRECERIVRVVASNELAYSTRLSLAAWGNRKGSSQETY